MVFLSPPPKVRTQQRRLLTHDQPTTNSMSGTNCMRGMTRISYNRTHNEGRPQAELSDAGDDIDSALREAQVVLQRIGEEAKRITEGDGGRKMEGDTEIEIRGGTEGGREK